MGRSAKRGKVEATRQTRASSRPSKGKEKTPAVYNSDNAASGSAHPKSKKKTEAGTNNNSDDASGSGSAQLGPSAEKDEDEDLSPQGLARTLFKTLNKGRQGCHDLERLRDVLSSLTMPSDDTVKQIFREELDKERKARLRRRRGDHGACSEDDEDDETYVESDADAEDDAAKGSESGDESETEAPTRKKRANKKIWTTDEDGTDWYQRTKTSPYKMVKSGRRRYLLSSKPEFADELQGGGTSWR